MITLPYYDSTALYDPNFIAEDYRNVPARVFIRSGKRKPEEPFKMYRKAMRNMAKATKQIKRLGSGSMMQINIHTMEVR